MAEDAEEMVGESEDSNFCNPTQGGLHAKEITLSAALTRLISAVLFPGPDTPGTFQHRVKVALSEYAPLLCEASQNTARNIYAWTRRGSPFRALLLLSVKFQFLSLLSCFGTTGLLIFMIFFVAATVNAIVISLVISLVVAGGFLVLLFACLIAIYLGALFAAILVISTATISAIITVSIAAVVRLDRILVYRGASNKEEHLSCKEFLEHNSISVFISFVHSAHHMNQSYD
nr:Voltage-dependent L-type calcium channel subunit alpha-1F [Ipomoea batatas]GMC67599.1 Voltage-dependent L-type calcium channel subunit alpha-1F [Ipomoea batatas]